MLSITNDTWAAEVLEAGGLVLVDFWQPDCQPCKQTARQIDQLRVELEHMKPTWKFVSCNIYECTDLAVDYRVMATPTIVVFKNGKEMERINNSRYSALHELVKRWSGDGIQ